MKKIILLLILSTAPALAQQDQLAQNTQQACTPDVMRLCMQAVNEGPAAVGACLNRNHALVSAACRAAYHEEKKAGKR